MTSENFLPHYYWYLVKQRTTTSKELEPLAITQTSSGNPNLINSIQEALMICFNFIYHTNSWFSCQKYPQKVKSLKKQSLCLFPLFSIKLMNFKTLVKIRNTHDPKLDGEILKQFLTGLVHYSNQIFLFLFSHQISGQN